MHFKISWRNVFRYYIHSDICSRFVSAITLQCVTTASQRLKNVSFDDLCLWFNSLFLSGHNIRGWWGWNGMFSIMDQSSFTLKCDTQIKMLMTFCCSSGLILYTIEFDETVERFLYIRIVLLSHQIQLSLFDITFSQSENLRVRRRKLKSFITQ